MDKQPTARMKALEVMADRLPSHIEGNILANAYMKAMLPTEKAMKEEIHSIGSSMLMIAVIIGMKLLQEALLLLILHLHRILQS